MLKKNDLVYIKKSVLETCYERGWYGRSVASTWVGRVTKITARREFASEMSYITTATSCYTRKFSLLDKDLVKLDFIKCLVADQTRFFSLTQLMCERGKEVYVLNLIKNGEVGVYLDDEVNFISKISIRKLLQESIIFPMRKSKKKIKVFIEEKEIV